MDEKKRREFKERLLAEKRRLTAYQEAERFDLDQSLTDSVKELSAYDNHPADLGSETFEREKDLALWNNSNEIMARIADALQRMEEGKYGICEDCGREIGWERLEAMPYTSLCIDCRREDEAQRQTRRRPVEEELLAPPFGRTFLDRADQAGTDGEDIWQDVAKHGTSETPSDLGATLDYEENFYDAPEPDGWVEKVDGIIDVGPDAIPPDPEV